MKAKCRIKTGIFYVPVCENCGLRTYRRKFCCYMKRHSHQLYQHIFISLFSFISDQFDTIIYTIKYEFSLYLCVF